MVQAGDPHDRIELLLEQLLVRFAPPHRVDVRHHFRRLRPLAQLLGREYVQRPYRRVSIRKGGMVAGSDLQRLAILRHQRQECLPVRDDGGRSALGSAVEGVMMLRFSRA